MKIDVNQPVMDLATGQPARFLDADATLRAVIIYVGQNPGSRDGPENPEEAAKAFDIAVRTATAPDGMLSLDLNEASFLKTRAYRMCFPLFAGTLDKALEAAAEAEATKK